MRKIRFCYMLIFLTCLTTSCSNDEMTGSSNADLTGDFVGTYDGEIKVFLPTGGVNTFQRVTTITRTGNALVRVQHQTADFRAEVFSNSDGIFLHVPSQLAGNASVVGAAIDSLGTLVNGALDASSGRFVYQIEIRLGGDVFLEIYEGVKR